MYWRRSFTEGDTNYSNQFWYARQLFINGKRPESDARFEVLKAVRVDPQVKHKARGLIADADKSPVLFYGQVTAVETTYAHIRPDGEGFVVYVSRSGSNDSIWKVLTVGRRVRCNIGFNYYGLTAVDLRPGE